MGSTLLRGCDRAFIVWGIEDKTKIRLGTTVRLKEVKKGGENLENWLTHIFEPRITLELLDFEEDGKPFSILSIDPAYDRPVRFAGAEYIRIGENVKFLKDFPERERAIWIATGRRKFEDAVALPHQSAEDVIEKLSVDTYYRLANEPRPDSPLEVIRRFERLEFIKQDWEGGYDITNLGALLFANDIRVFPSIALKSVRVIRYEGVDKTKSDGEIEGQRGYAVGFSGLIKHVLDSLPKAEKYPGGVRALTSVYSEIAIREITANALIHQDLTINGSSPVIEIYHDRIEVTNPGNSLIERDRMIDERRSRNEKLAKTMRDLGFCEERGGGIDKAIIDIEERSLPAPVFFASENSMRIVLFGPKQFADLSKADKVWACFCHCVVRWLSHDFMGNASLRRRFSLGDDDYQAVSAVIADARREGRIVVADVNQGNRNARYVPYWARTNGTDETKGDPA